MGRERVSKGVIIPKKDFKVIEVLQGLEPDASDEKFFKAFSEKYPEDLDRVQKRYDEHVRLTKPGKHFPMARPYQYVLSAAKTIRDKYRKGENLDDLLVDLNTPKPKFIEERPSNIESLVNASLNMESYEARIDAINNLGKWKCDESIAALTALMASDPFFDVRDTAYQRLKRFGLDVIRPNKDKPYIDKEIQAKVLAIIAELKPGYTQEKFEKKFKAMYPLEFDLQKYHQKNRFKHWIKKLLANAPKSVASLHL